MNMSPLIAKTLLIALISALSIVSECIGADMPPFDREKAKALSAEKRRQYDLVFFNEIEMVHTNSNRYMREPPIDQSFERRAAEFKQMALDGYLPAYAALRLRGVMLVQERDDAEALEMLIQQAEAGDTSATCAVSRIPKTRKSWGQRNVFADLRRLVREGAIRGHGACQGEYGGWLLLGNFPGVAEDRKAAMPLLLASAAQGYYLPVRHLFSIRDLKALRKEFDFTDKAELDRALCWGRLAQQHTNSTGFDSFYSKLREYARTNNRPDLRELSFRFSSERVPIIEQLVKPEDCIRLEKGE